MKKLLLFYLLCCSFFAGAQQLVYKPINPAFGGDTFNYQWLLSSASAQNQFDNDKDSNLFREESAIQGFQNDLDRQILNQLSRDLFGGNFGEVDMEPGIYNYGNLYIEIKEYNRGLIIQIFNTQTGEQTEILLPGR